MVFISLKIAALFKIILILCCFYGWCAEPIQNTTGISALHVCHIRGGNSSRNTAWALSTSSVNPTTPMSRVSPQPDCRVNNECIRFGLPADGLFIPIQMSLIFCACGDVQCSGGFMQSVWRNGSSWPWRSRKHGTCLPENLYNGYSSTRFPGEFCLYHSFNRRIAGGFGIELDGF